EKGKNYGWPDIEGDASRDNMIKPAHHSGTDDTWAPASMTYFSGNLLFGGLRGEAVYQVILDGPQVIRIQEYFKGIYGRIRTTRVGPDGMIYITTSNTDG